MALTAIIALAIVWQTSTPAYCYSMGKMHLEHPVVLSFLKTGDNYVCPDSVIAHYQDSSWTARPDVYPYVLVWPGAYSKNNETISYTNIFHYHRRYDRRYDPFDHYEKLNDSVIMYHFAYDVQLFDAVMQANSARWTSSLGDQYYEDLDWLSYDETSYRLALRQHYSLLQILTLRIRWRKKHL